MSGEDELGPFLLAMEIDCKSRASVSDQGPYIRAQYTKRRRSTVSKSGSKGGAAKGGHAQQQRSNVRNPNNPAHQAAQDNRANQLNQNNPARSGRSSSSGKEPSGSTSSGKKPDRAESARGGES